MHIAIIGHISRDITANGYTLGGAVSYAGITARRLGADVTILTRAHPKDAQQLKDEGINVINLPTNVYTTFRNDYHNGFRTQQLLAVAAPILASETPEKLYQADALLLAPVAQEVDPAIASRATHMLLAASPQGWMREWDAHGRVLATSWYSSGRILPYLDAIIFSDADLAGDTSILPIIINTVPLTVITKASKGCVLYHRGHRHIIPPRPVHEVDATGAGDTFTAAFLIELLNGARPEDAAYFANVTASMAIEGLGATTIPNRKQVQSYIRTHPKP